MTDHGARSLLYRFGKDATQARDSGAVVRGPSPIPRARSVWSGGTGVECGCWVGGGCEECIEVIRGLTGVGVRCRVSPRI